MPSTLAFCGRGAEIDELIARWRLASNVHDPTPQTIVIKAERGLGKTRLAVEFYRWLSEQADSAGNVYWPRLPELTGNNLEVNPSPYNCLFQLPIPFLWWGIRAGDPGTENGVGGDAIATYHRYLAPHLVALLTRARTRHKVWEVAKAWLEVGLDVASTHLEVDTILSVGKGVLRSLDLLTERTHDAALSAAMQGSVGRVDAVLQDLEKVFNPRSSTYAATPSVFFVDDAQFAHHDAGLPPFIERLLHTATTQKWPALILLTHWKAEMSPTLTSAPSAVVGILNHARNGSPSERGPAAALPGGYLGSVYYSELDLGPVADLSPALRDRLPGLTSEHASGLLDALGGNPRFLEQLIALLFENENFFLDFDPRLSLTEEGLREALKELKSQDIFTIVLRRLRNAPEEVQEAICLASLQGPRFVAGFVDTLAHRSLSRSVLMALNKGEDPYSMLTGISRTPAPPIAQFAERLFYEAAIHRRGSLKRLGGEGTLQSTFREHLLATVGDTDDLDDVSEEVQGLLYGLAANMFERSPQPKERELAQRSLGRLARIELNQYSFERAAAAYERFLEIPVVSADPPEMDGRARTRMMLTRLYVRLKFPGKAAQTLRALFSEVISYTPDGSDAFIRATDAAAASGLFLGWQERHPDLPTDLYLWTCRWMVRSLLNLSELARERPQLPVSADDISLDERSFLIFTRPASASVPEHVGEQPSNHLIVADTLIERAYAQDGVLGAGWAERQHLDLLGDLARLASEVEDDYHRAERLLLRALQLSSALGDDLGELDILNNLGLVAGRSGNSAGSIKYLESARARVDSIAQEDSFPVDLVVDEPDAVDPTKMIARAVGRVAIPARYSAEFDADPEGVRRKAIRLRHIAANIYGNIGSHALQATQLEEAETYFLKAVTIHEEIGALDDMSIGLDNLARVAIKMGDKAKVCAYCTKWMVLLRELHGRDRGTMNERRWQAALSSLESQMMEYGCVERATDV